MDEEESFTYLEKEDTEEKNTDALQELPKLSGNITDMTMCAIYPLLALTSDTGLVSVYNWIAKEIICSYSYILSATTVIWPNPKIDSLCFFVWRGFGCFIIEFWGRENNQRRWNKAQRGHKGNLDLNISKKQETSSSEEMLVEDKEQDSISEILQHKDNEHEHVAADEKEEDEEYNLKLQAVTKPHTDAISCLGVNEESLVLVSQGLDSKLFFFHLKDFDFIPLGFFKILVNFGFENFSKDLIYQDSVHLLIFCKHSYILEVDIPSIFSDATDDSRLTYCIEKFNCQIYKINGLLKYHELGDRVSDINLDEVSDIGRDVLLNLKYQEKKKKREAKEQELGISGPPVPPKILSHLPSKFPGRLWLSLGKNDSGYLFEFQFIKEFQEEPIEFIPCRAVEIITANYVPIISMNFSFCGKFLYMGLEDGTLHYCCLHDLFEPSSSYGFEKLEVPGSAPHSVENAYASPDGSLLTRSGDDSHRIEFKLNMVGHKDVIEYGALPSFPSIISCCPKAVELFKEKTKALLREQDKEYERDLVKTSLIKQKYLECFKSKISSEKFFVEEEGQKVENYRGCIMPSFTRNGQTKYQQVYGIKVDRKEESQELPIGKSDANKKSNKTDKLKQKLTSLMKDIISYPIDGPATDIILKYNKRKQDLAERLKQRIATEEALDNIVFDEDKYKNTRNEIQESLYKFKDTVGYEFVFPSINCTYPEKKGRALAYLNMLHNFQELFNSYVADAQNLEDSIHHHDMPVEKKLFMPTGKPLDLKKIHISVVGDKNIKVEKRYIKIDWNSKSRQEPIKQDKCSNAANFKNLWAEKMFKNLVHLLQAIKPKIDCEKKFMEIRFLMKCIELNLWKPTLSDEKLYVKILDELQEMLSFEEKDLFSIEKEITDLKNLRHQEKEKWMNLYHDLIKIIGRNHKYKGYFKQIFKKKIHPNGEKRSQIRHSSSESSESEQNIDSDDDKQNVDLSDIDEELLKRVMQLRLKRQEVEQRMKEYKRKIRSISVKQNAIKRKIQKRVDAKNETYEKLNNILDSRKQMCDRLIWPLVLYPGNIHSDYISTPNSNLGEQKQLLQHEMFRIYGTVNEKLKAVNNYVRVSLLLLTTNVVTMEIQDMIDAASVFFSLVQSVSVSTDEYFESLRHTESLSSLKGDLEADKEESSTFIEDILETVAESVPLSETSLQSISQQESSSKKTSNGKEISSSTLVSEKDSEEPFDLEELKGEDYEIKEQEELRPWQEVCNDIDLLGLADKSYLQSQNINSVVSNAIPQKTGEKVPIDSSKDDVDYYRRPFTYHTSENVQKTCYTDPADTSDSESDTELNQRHNDLKNGQEPDYPTFPHGGLLLNISVLRDMEKSDPRSYPYTDFYQEIEFREELTVAPVAIHIEPARTADMDILYNFIPTSFSGFILVNSNNIGKILKFYSRLKAAPKELEQELKLLENKVMTTKRALNFKHQDLIKERRELYGAMKSTFNHVIDLDLLQDTIENPLLHIKKAEFKTELDNMKSKLKKMKESEALAQRALDQLRFEDTQICYELLELRKEFKMLDEGYSKCQVLPRIGVIKKTEESSENIRCLY
ncbi:hypothetical protein HNY73_021895 [Argiope bruennichi]|uniref:Uncharacterized protein n=1 Tax=Argiope bruennichi TaxID=94029 RepID=A0A8T0E2T1_ARGBR|nr:hypothetical protein HNY73_021895 [Argiope bruennichi]